MVNVTADYRILDLQIKNFKNVLDIDLKDIIVVVGYKKELITENYPELSFVCNEDYESTGTAKSLLKGAKLAINNDLLWINGDVVFDPDILNMIVKNKDHNVVVVDNKYSREVEIKYNIDNQGFVKDVSKDMENSIGELIGINLIKKDAIPQFIYNLELSDDLDYFDRAIQKTIKDGHKFIPLNIGDKFSIEIDYIHELETAEKWVNDNI
jgi:L-glutamine-phosphate cytidylyltransferase